MPKHKNVNLGPGPYQIRIKVISMLKAQVQATSPMCFRAKNKQLQSTVHQRGMSCTAPITNKLDHMSDLRAGYGDEESESHRRVTGCTEQYSKSKHERHAETGDGTTPDILR